MQKFTVSCDLLVPVLLEIEADDEDHAIDRLHEMSRRNLLALANTEESALGIVDGSETSEAAP